MIVAKRQQGIAMTESDQQWLDRAEGMKSLAEAEIQNLNTQIEELREERIKYRKAEASVKLGELTSGGKYGMDYISY
jgi:prefoldin subunit 5